jgi:DamX protein
MRTEPSFSEEPENKLSRGDSEVLGSGFESESSPLSDYRQRYGLSVDPFIDDPHFPFYQGAQRRQILEQLLHLCQFSHNLLVIAGEYGVGKTRMAQALIDALDDADDICFVEGQITSDINSLLTEVFVQFELTSRDEFAGFCKKSSDQDGLVVLIIDNAHHLTDEVITELVGLVQENAESRLHLVLFSEPYLLDRLETIHAPDIVLTDFVLEKFSLAEAVDYLNFRMEMADYLGPEIFIEAKVEPWWRQAQGQLLFMHEQAREKLLASVSVPQRARSYAVIKRSLPIPHIIIVSVLAGGLLLGYFYLGGDSSQKSIAKVNEPIPVVIQSEPATYNSSQAISAQASSLATINPVVATEYKSTEIVRSAASVPVHDASSAEKSQAASVSVVKQSVVPLAQTNEFHTENSQKQNKLNSVSSSRDAKKIENVREPAKIVAKTKSDITAVAEPKSPQIFSEQERTILAWDDSEFTLQLVGLSNEKAAHDFLAAQPNKKDLLLFKSKRLGKDWFVVVTGHFVSSAKARQMVENLPESQKKALPWPREVKVIQKEIRQK